MSKDVKGTYLAQSAAATVEIHRLIAAEASHQLAQKFGRHAYGRLVCRPAALVPAAIYGNLGYSFTIFGKQHTID